MRLRAPPFSPTPWPSAQPENWSMPRPSAASPPKNPVPSHPLEFFPVADVNSNPANPIINTRSFGEDPQQVGNLLSAYIRGAHSEGMLTTAQAFSRTRRHRHRFPSGSSPGKRHGQTTWIWSKCLRSVRRSKRN